jgi:hypothetical protein
VRPPAERLWIAVLATALLALTVFGPGLRLARASESVVEVSVKVTLGPLFSALEQQVPLEVRQDDGWHQHDGVLVRYAARRGPLELRMRGDTVLARTLVGYWVQARKEVLGRIPIRGSCGIDEPPRGVALGLVSRVFLRPDWRLAAVTAPLPPQFLNPCRMTFAGIDVTSSLARALGEKLWRTARIEIDGAVPRLLDLRSLAELAWERLQAPVAIDEGLWLILNPTAISATQPVADGRDLSVVIGVHAAPHLSDSPQPRSPPSALPPLRLELPRPAAVELPIRVSLPHEDADRLLRERLQGKTLEWAGREVTIEKIRLVGGQGTLTVEAVLTGAVDGSVHLSGRPGYDADTGEAYLGGLDYTFETGDLDLRRREQRLHELIRVTIVQKTRWPLAGRLESWRRRLEDMLTGPLPPFFTRQAALTTIRPTTVRVTDSATLVEGVLGGEVRLKVLGL